MTTFQKIIAKSQRIQAANCILDEACCVLEISRCQVWGNNRDELLDLAVKLVVNLP